MRSKWIGLLAGGCLALTGCGGGGSSAPPTAGPAPAPSPAPTPTPSPSPTPAVIAVDFATDGGNWIAGIADYAPGQEAEIAFQSGLRALPAPLAPAQGYLLGGTNRSDDLAMFAYRLVQQLEPGRKYRIESSVRIATNAPEGCVGAGGAPDAVTFKVGAAPKQPATTVSSTGRVQVNVDKGNQVNSGTEAVAAGSIGSPNAGACLAPQYAYKTLTVGAGNAPVVAADASGRLWLFVSTDSGFEARTEIYLVNATFTLTAQ